MKPLYFSPLLALLLFVSASSANAGGSGLKVRCEGNDVGAEVSVNGAFKGECPLVIEVAPGSLKLRAFKSDSTYDYVFEQDIRLGDGVVKNIDVVLEKRLNAAGQRAVNERLAAERVAQQRREAEAEARRQAVEARRQAALSELKSQGAEPGNGKAFRDCPECPEMIVLPEGRFQMGTSPFSSETVSKPEHQVEIRQFFALGKTEITRGQFAAFVTETGYVAGDTCWVFEPQGFFTSAKWVERSGDWRNPGYQQDDSHPVACISWNDAKSYVKWLSRKTGKPYRLPTESEWEYACMAGERLQYCGSNNLDSVGWYERNSANSTHPVASKQANAWGLYDMTGNIFEWVEDVYHDSYYGAPADGSAWQGNSAQHTLRGGAFMTNNDNYYLGGTYRSDNNSEVRGYNIGFRIARTIPQ